VDKIIQIKQGRKNKYQYQDITYDSKEEVYFLWYLSELERAGLVSKVEYQPKTYVLREPEHYQWEKQLKKKVKTMEGSLLRGCSYTYDFHWLWEEKTRGTFFDNITSGKKLTAVPFWTNRDVSCVDVKGGFRGRNHREFEVKRKWLRDKYDIFVQEVIPGKLFAKTFTPERFLTCDSLLTRKRVINFEVRELGDFVNK